MSDFSYLRLPDNNTDSDECTSYDTEKQLQYALSSPNVSPGLPGAHHDPPGPTGRGSQASSTTQQSLLTRQLASSRTRGPTKKGRRIKWSAIYSNGDSRSIEADKRSIIQMMGLEIPIRDMRLLDVSVPSLETVAQILVRDNAMVFIMEHVRLVITADRALVPLDGALHLEGFAKDLETAVRERGAEDRMIGEGEERKANNPDQLPFELHVLEIALGEICGRLAQDTKTLESAADPALEALRRNSDTDNLEKVRKVKARHQRLLGRVKAVREMLERYLEDDGDMYRMCLSRRKETEAEGGAAEHHHIIQRMASARRPLPIPIPPGSMTLSTLSHSHSLQFPLGMGGGADPTVASEASDYHDLLDVENLLESYFFAVNSTFRQLLALGEYIDDTEDYINIELDYNRNRLIRFEILLTTATFALAFFAVVSGILGENVPIPQALTKENSFLRINVLTLMFCMVVFTGVVHILRSKKLV